MRLAGRYFEAVATQPKDATEVGRLVEGWYRAHAGVIFEKRLQVCLSGLRGFSGLNPPLLVRRLKTRWGSCSKAGRVLLNSELVQAPVECIDYVIVHELCHLKVPDHSLAFFRLLARCMPDWRRRKEKLESLRF